MPPAAKKKNDRLTDEERQCVRTLEILAEKWPPTLLLFAAGPDTNTLHILKTDEEGDPIRLPDERGGGYDPKSIVGQVTIRVIKYKGYSLHKIYDGCTGWRWVFIASEGCYGWRWFFTASWTWAICIGNSQFITAKSRTLKGAKRFVDRQEEKVQR